MCCRLPLRRGNLHQWASQLDELGDHFTEHAMVGDGVTYVLSLVPVPISDN
ncbi:Hypothetical protein CINCED_3A001561 [Cinara cedri]|uniref:Uncharacterized protein n=1 Tax=Cinara cedri TaxID=506608 RepID=A0A5E4MFT7_9HEMI|nr:Hypothetical protein CINCED_3A001561 [Cinara cedri]